MEQRQHLVTLAVSGRFTVTELCAEFGVSRKTAHKWIALYRQHGAAGLADGSRAPKSVPGRTCEEVERMVVAERRLHRTWGPKKIRARLQSVHGIENPPATSTIGAILKRHGMVESRRRKPGAFNVERGTLTPAERPNHVLGVDFKGWFTTADGERCDPLTVSDLHSRYLLRAEALRFGSGRNF